MHSNTHGLRTCNIRDVGFFLLSTVAVYPGIDPMQSDFTSGSDQRSEPICNVRRVIARSPYCRRRAGHRLPRIALRGQNEKCGLRILFNINIAIELKPKVLCQPKIDEWQLRRSEPIG